MPRVRKVLALHLMLILAAAVLPTPASACEGSDAGDTWENATAVAEHFGCSAQLTSLTDVADWFRNELLIGAVESSITVTVCAVNPSYHFNVDLYFRDFSSRSSGQGPFQMDNAQEWTRCNTVSSGFVPASNGAWYVRVTLGGYLCCEQTEVYTMDWRQTHIL